MTSLNIWVLMFAVVSALLLLVLLIAKTGQREEEANERSPERAARETREAAIEERHPEGQGTGR